MRTMAFSLGFFSRPSISSITPPLTSFDTSKLARTAQPSIFMFQSDGLNSPASFWKLSAIMIPARSPFYQQIIPWPETALPFRIQFLSAPIWQTHCWSRPSGVGRAIVPGPAHVSGQEGVGEVEKPAGKVPQRRYPIWIDPAAWRDLTGFPNLTSWGLGGVVQERSDCVAAAEQVNRVHQVGVDSLRRFRSPSRSLWLGRDEGRGT